MQNANERREQIAELISDRRKITLSVLMEQFGISKATAKRDIEILACSYPIYTQTGGAGGIYAMDGWYIGRRYLHRDQEALLRKLLPGLQPEDQKTMERILTSFAKPTKEAHR